MVSKIEKDAAKLIVDVTPNIMRAIRLEMRVVRGAGLSVPQFRVIARIALSGSCTNRDLAEWMGVSAPSMSRMVDTLVRRGLIVRKTQESDRREVLLDLTPRGWKTYRNFRTSVEKKFANYLTDVPMRSKKAILEAFPTLADLFA